MNTQAYLRQQAIDAAKNREWQEAIAINSQILELNPADTGALNRLGVAQIQLGDKKSAKAAFEKALEFDSSNSLAKKHLQKLKSNQVTMVPSFSRTYFIEEPGKTKTVELCRLAGKNSLDALSVGQPCELKQKNRYISIESNGQHIGALPEDISFRLSKLINTGNTYTCTIRSCSNNTCSVFIKETFRSAENSDIHSFPIKKSGGYVIRVTSDSNLRDQSAIYTTSDSNCESVTTGVLQLFAQPVYQESNQDEVNQFRAAIVIYLGNDSIVLPKE